MSTVERRDWTTDLGIGVVGLAAAILTFTTLRDLGLAVGITAKLFDWFELAWLLPVTIDAAGIVAARVWLRGHAGDEAVRFAQWLTVSCIGLSVAGNAGQHVMAEFHVDAPWGVVVLVTAVPPAMLGAVVHLGHLLGRSGRSQRSSDRSTVADLVAQTNTAAVREPVIEAVQMTDAGPVHMPAPMPDLVPAGGPVHTVDEAVQMTADVTGPVTADLPAVMTAEPVEMDRSEAVVEPVEMPAPVTAVVTDDVTDVDRSDQPEHDDEPVQVTGPVTDEQVLEWLQVKAAADRKVPGRAAVIKEWSIGASRADRLRGQVTVPRRLKRVQ